MCTNGIGNGVIAQLAEDVAGAEGLLDKLELVAIDDVGQKTGVLVYDGRLERHHLASFELHIPGRDR